jgi:hypothetical protein
MKVGPEGSGSDSNQSSMKTTNLPFDADGTTFQSTFGLPHTNIQRCARGGNLAGEWWKSGDPNIKSGNATNKKRADRV